ncbi:MAG TPA: hypothetical protein VND45_04425 [Thermoanaerobaculia bacterium]|jgi:hypothetical protein|nr:hypothetical protein [Thermoanaerobaculia bacterium]
MAHAYAVGPDPKPAPHPRAVFVAHGMGQQVPFATLDDVARGLCKTAGMDKVAEVRANSVRAGCETLQRLELTFLDGRPPIHIYEGYWAPLTEGVVGIWQVVRFLLAGGFNGIRSGGTLRRFMFGKEEEFDISKRHMMMLYGAVVLVLGLIIIGTVAFTVGAASIFLHGWIPEPIVSELTAAFELLLAILIPCVITAVACVIASRVVAAARLLTIALGLIVAVPILVAAYVRIPLIFLFGLRPPFVPLEPCVVCGVSWTGSLRHSIGGVLWRVHESLGEWCVRETFLWAMLVLAAALLLVFALWNLIREPARAQTDDTKRNSKGHRTGVVIAAIVLFAVLAICGRSDALALVTWLLVLAITLFVRWFLIQFIGDVAAYVSPHVVDRFFELRQNIKERVWRAARAVYAMREEDGGWTYDSVAIVGHSLGSVVVYDTLNRLLIDDTLATQGRPCTERPTDALDIERRTKLFLTFGSPLDKTAFVFAMHDRGGGTERDALATSVQPLIARPRTIPWVNVYSNWDVLGGQLDFYDTPRCDNPGLVENEKDPDATTPIIAHIEFWQNPMIYDIIHQYV